jgi:GNAT superfamily N-acetyltransferase
MDARGAPVSDLARIRHIADADWDAIEALESRAYAGLGLSEGRAALRSRADASPSTCFVLDVGSRPAGYLLALPYPAFQYPDLERTEETVEPSPCLRNLHLHDLVITESLRGRGLARHLLHHLTRTARAHGHEQISLIAVGGSETFWSARGFTAHPGISPGGYGTHAVYMSKAVPPDSAARPEPAGIPPRGSSLTTKRADARVPCP